ncbi:SPFH domain-containing protein [Methylocapsa acidiphila]|uniref:SPFH domain-containing protein n=1 Tax=Methylocapsa acidiphila TaxID=133552 RepID=UPI0004163103|nr:SPFH domain-containing protein [Methylocapsa acidiphila]
MTEVQIAATIALLILVLLSLRTANQYQRAVVFRLGRYVRTAGPGLYFLIPLIEWAWTIDMRTMTTAVEQQEAITKDNVPVKINAVIWRALVQTAQARHICR